MQVNRRHTSPSCKGATHFILLSYGSLGLLPSRAYAPSDVYDHFDRLSTQLQTSLLSLRYRLCRGLGLHVGFADVYTLFHKMTSKPSDYGFDETRVDVSCLIGAFDEAPRSLCTEPDKYIFWDEYHVGHLSAIMNELQIINSAPFFQADTNCSSIYRCSGMEGQSRFV